MAIRRPTLARGPWHIAPRSFPHLGNHGPDHRIFADNEIYHHGSVIGFHRQPDGWLHFFLCSHANSQSAIGVGELDEVGNHNGVMAGVEVREGMAAVIEE